MDPGLVLGLESRDLVVRTPHPERGRILLVGLTDSGRALIGTTHARVGNAEKRMISGLSTDKVEAFVDMLDACANTLDRSSTRVVAQPT